MKLVEWLDEGFFLRARGKRRGVRRKIVGFEFLTAVVMKNFVFSDITSCSPLKVNRFF
jgi:hypothetical protein